MFAHALFTPRQGVEEEWVSQKRKWIPEGNGFLI